MFIRIIFTVGLYFVFFVLGAQNPINAGLTLGAATTQIEGDGYAGFKKLGIIAGGFVSRSFTPQFSVELSIYFINKGSYKPLDIKNGDNTSFYMNINYVEIPLLLQYNYKEKFIIEAGLFEATFLGYNLRTESGKIDINAPFFNRVEIGGLLGLAYPFSDHFTVGVRTKSSFTPSRSAPSQDNKNGVLNTLFTQGWYNIGINLMLKYQFFKS